MSKTQGVGLWSINKRDQKRAGFPQIMWTLSRDSLEKYRTTYNTIRPHWALRPSGGGDPVTPEDVYAKGVEVTIPKWQHWAKAAKKKLDQMMEQDAAKVAA